MNINLNNINASTNYGEFLENGSIDYSVYTKEINVYFRNLKYYLISHIRQHDIIVGCVAWLTDFDILDELSNKEVFIVVQKEDFLRPDTNIEKINNWKCKLQEKYKNVKIPDIWRGGFNNELSSMSYSGSPISPIMCVGNHNSNKSPAFPRMHNKFIIFCERDDENIKPKSVWTGSFNFTYNATQSFENSVYISNNKIVEAYYNEFGHIATMAEELDWKSNWVSPEWRIGS